MIIFTWGAANMCRYINKRDEELKSQGGIPTFQEEVTTLLHNMIRRVNREIEFERLDYERRRRNWRRRLGNSVRQTLDFITERQSGINEVPTEFSSEENVPDAGQSTLEAGPLLDIVATDNSPSPP